MDLQSLYSQHGAVLAGDGIPLHFGDLAAEYYAALERTILLDRSHEGRLAVSGRDRLALIHRMSTNHVEQLAPGEGKPTIFTNATARIIDRVMLYHRADHALAITEPGRGAAVGGYLQRNIFFNDEVRLNDITAQTRQFALHGPAADALAAELAPEMIDMPPLYSRELIFRDMPLFIARSKPLSGQHWTIITAIEHAPALWQMLIEVGARHGIQPAGSLTYNTLRIRAGRPGVGRELSLEYIPLEVGLFDEISFAKGCYTGQEIIARMESRSRIARIMVCLLLAAPVETPAEVYQADRAVGTLTSSVSAPDGQHYGIAVIKTAAAVPGTVLSVGHERISARIVELAGTPPPMVNA